MRLEDYLDFQGPDVIRINGHRIGIEHIVEHYWNGYTPEQIAREFPSLSMETIYGTITYYLHNKAAVETYIERINRMREKEYQEWLKNPSPLTERMRAARRRFDEERKRRAS